MYFRYKAYEEGDAVREGIIEGTVAEDVRAEIRSGGLHLVSLSEIKKAGKTSFLSPAPLALFAGEWSALISAGIPVTEALSVLRDGQGKKEKQVLLELQSTIEAGHGISESFRKSGAFPPFFCALLQVGELSGTLPDQLSLAAACYKKEAALMQNLRLALLYPLTVLLFAVLVSVLVLAFLLPSFALLFDALAVPLPQVTRAALAAGLFLQKHGIIVFVVILSFLWGLFRWTRTEKGKEKTDALLFRSAFVRKTILVRFTRALSALLESGVTLSEALKHTALMENNLTASREIFKWAAAVEKGGDFPKLVTQSGWTGNAFPRMLRAGMESGQLPLFLKHAAEWIAGDVDMKLRRFRKMAEPVMIQGCIFDMDGLLFDTERIFQENWEKIAVERGIVLPPSFTGDIMGTSGEKMNRILERYYRPYKGEEIQKECKKRVEAALKNHVPLMPGAVEILETCRALRIKTAVASSSPMEQIKANLSLTGTDIFFDALVSGEEVKKGKPAPDIFLLAAERIHVPPACCLVFEDSPHGIAGAAEGGFIPVMIPCLLPPAEENKKVAHIYKNLRDAGNALLKKK